MITFNSTDGKWMTYMPYSDYLVAGAYNASCALGLTNKARQRFVWRFIGFKP